MAMPSWYIFTQFGTSFVQSSDKQNYSPLTGDGNNWQKFSTHYKTDSSMQTFLARTLQKVIAVGVKD